MTENELLELVRSEAANLRPLEGEYTFNEMHALVAPNLTRGKFRVVVDDLIAKGMLAVRQPRAKKFYKLVGK